MAVRCGKCGAHVSSRAALPGHYRRAHGPRRGQSCQAAIVPAKPKAALIQGQVIDVEPVRSETRIVPVKPRPKPKAVEISSGDRPPSWWEAQADREWRIVVWSRFNADYKAELLRRGPIQTEQTGTIPGDSVVGGFGLAVSCIRGPDSTDLWSQYYVLKALAVQLDVGRGTEQDRLRFEAGLREYDANFDRIRAQKKALPG